MINIDEATEQIKKTDNLLTESSRLLKKHWFILVIILITVSIYESCEFLKNSDSQFIETNQTQDYLQAYKDSISDAANSYNDSLNKLDNKNE